jgi:hypothetical protein
METVVETIIGAVMESIVEADVVEVISMERAAIRRAAHAAHGRVMKTRAAAAAE